MLKLIVQETGRERQEFLLEKKTYTIGRNDTNDIVISDEGVSRWHAVLKFEDDHFFIQDIKSSGGVFVNDRKIAQKTLVTGGETIVVGETNILVSRGGETDTFAATNVQGEGKTTILPADAYESILQNKGQKDKPDAEIPEPVSPGSEADHVDSAHVEGKTTVLSADAYESILQNTVQKDVPDAQIPEPFSPENEIDHVEDKTAFYDLKSPSDISAPSFHKLVVISNKGYGKEFILNNAECVIGRNPDCLIQIEDNKISAQHALITVRDNDCSIKDLKSSNGTRVNGRTIKQLQSVQTGDEIEIGSTIFRFIHKDTIFE